MKKNTSISEEVKAAFREAVENYPGPAFSREGLSEFLGSTISVGRLANLDSEGKGPDGGFYHGRRKMYLKGPAVEWAIRRLEV